MQKIIEQLIEQHMPLEYDPAYEVREEDEDKTIQGLKETLAQIADKTYEDSGHAFRSVHLKSHGILRAELEVRADLPPLLAQGMFAQPARYPVVMRFSTSPGDELHDKVSTPRGLAIKVIGVNGERLPGSEADVTQDFVLVNGPAFLVPGPKKFLANLKMLAATTDKAPEAKKVLSAALRGTEKLVEAAGGESAKLKALGGHPLTHVLGDSFFSQVPMLYGKHMVKVAVVPVSPELQALSGQTVDLDDRPNGLREEVIAHFAKYGGEWELRVQFCTDLERMPIEDASVVWSEEESPYIAVARIHAEPQEAWSDALHIAVDDGMSFSPWHGLAAHRPIGSIMRVRKEAYKLSVELRAARNGVDIREPKDMSCLPELSHI